MVAPSRGEIWWADLGEPAGSEPGYLRPVLIVQDDYFNRSNLATIVVLSLTSNPRYAALPGSVFLPKEQAGLPKDSVVNVTQIAAIDKRWLREFVAQLPHYLMHEVELSLGLVLGLPY